ncbi:MAG: PD-(D/E)XK nuclease family protein [Rhodospirillales bacterium]|nr:PD-(D/E)XK nuclease family protein [Acetobacter sp.]
MSTMVDTLQPPPAEEQIIGRLLEWISSSQLSLFQVCRLRFYFRYVLGLRKPKTAALHVGVAVHAVLSHWNRARWRRQLFSLADLHASYQAAWQAEQAEEPVAWNNPASEAEQQQTGWRLLETFFRESPLREASKPDAVEVRVEADLARHGLPTLVGVLDLVQDGRIVDFKTSATTPHPERAALVHATQATAYALLYRENTGRKEAGIELHHLVKLKQPRLVVTTLPPMGEREQTRLLRVIDSYVSGLQRRDFIPSPGLPCVSCEFFAECAAWH